MKLSDIQKVLLAVSAACFLGIGSVFITFGEYVFERDRDVRKEIVSFESKSNITFSKNLDCEKFISYKSECKYVVNESENFDQVMEILLDVIYNLIGFGLFFLTISFLFRPSKK